jgi:2-dehydro-3-deoxy-D-gluconate 5-dehydrogenase
VFTLSITEKLFSLHGKNALVTGARTGIGQAIAVGLASAGSHLILVGHQNNMQETEAKIAEAGGTFETLLIDLSNIDDLPAKCEEIIKNYTVHILVNNAGIIRRQPAVEHSLENWKAVIDTNLHSVFILSQKLGEAMIRRNYGKIINIASLLSFQGGITVPSYTSSKHAITGLTKALANEWAAKGVQVNAIAPGYISTNNTQALRNNEERNEAILARIPAERWGKAEDLVGAALFLASPASDYVNGHVLVVDGGWMAR